MFKPDKLKRPLHQRHLLAKQRTNISFFFQKCKGSDFLGLEEMSVISVMCNDSAIDFNEYKNAFEKVGEATETALIVLAEKVNPYDADKRGGRLESAKAVR